MKKLQFVIVIDASREKVWNTLLEEETYREWTAPFSPAGSYFKGDWSKGSKILFIGIDAETGKEDSGLFAEIVESRLHEFVSVKHLGEIKDGVEVPWSNHDQDGFENYTLTDKDGGTEVFVELINIPDEWTEMMNDAWPKALAKLKEIAEATSH
ncbi:MAG: SRPBCC domain-containing protein [Minisyncoccia bacterium]